MNRILILAFALFAMVNAAPYEKREAAKFLPCPGLPPDVTTPTVNLTPFPIVPDSNETFVIKSTMNHDIDTGAFLGIAFIDVAAKQPIGEPLTVDICSQTKCPIKAGTEYDTTQVLKAPSAKELPPSYIIGIGIGSGTPPNVTPYACAYIPIGGDNAPPEGFDSLLF